MLNNANQSVYFMVFSFTSDPIGDIVLNKYLEGIDVKGIFEKRLATGKGSEYEFLKKNNVDVRVDGNKNTMHHKVFIIDRKIVITGSYNPTYSGNKKNDENILIIHDRSISKQFIDEFENLWEEALI